MAEGQFYFKEKVKILPGIPPEDLNAIEAKLDYPVVDAITDTKIAEAVGRKTDTANETANNVSSLMRYLKGVLAILGTRATAAATGAVSDVKSLVGYIKQLVTHSHEIRNKVGITGFDRTTDSLEALSESIAAMSTTAERGTDNALLATDYTAPDNANIVNIKTQTDKLAGEAPVAGATTANWNTAEADIISIGANNTSYKLHSLVLDINALAGTVTIRLYQQVNGVERRVYEQTFTVAVDGPGLWIVNGTVGIHEILRVTAQSNNVADDGTAIGYDFMLEVM